MKTDDLNAEIERLKGKGFKQINKISAPGIRGYETRSTYLFSKDAGLVELVQEIT